MKQIAMIALLALAACGGGGGGDAGEGGGGSGDGGAKGLFEDYADAQAGGYRDIEVEIGSTTVSEGCGYFELPSLAEAESAVKSAHGTVTSSSGEKWCGTTSDETFCLVRVGGSFVTDDTLTDTNTTAREYEILIPGLPGGQRSYFEMAHAGDLAYAFATVQRKDSSISDDSECSRTHTTQAPTAINQAWSGFSVAYDSNARTGTETAASMNCAGQVCTISGTDYGAIPLSAFETIGVWRGTFEGHIAGATISPDGKALSMYVCVSPLNLVNALSQCSFYSFSRQ